MTGQALPYTRLRTIADLAATARLRIFEHDHVPAHWRKLGDDVYYPYQACRDILVRMSEAQKRTVLLEIIDFRRADPVRDATFGDPITYGGLFDLIIEETVVAELSADEDLRTLIKQRESSLGR